MKRGITWPLRLVVAPFRAIWWVVKAVCIAILRLARALADLIVLWWTGSRYNRGLEEAALTAPSRSNASGGVPPLITMPAVDEMNASMATVAAALKSPPASPPKVLADSLLASELDGIEVAAHRTARAFQARVLRSEGIPLPRPEKFERIVDDVGMARARPILHALHTMLRPAVGWYSRSAADRAKARELLEAAARRGWL